MAVETKERVVGGFRSRFLAHLAVLGVAGLAFSGVEFRDGGIGRVSSEGNGWLVRPVLTEDGVEIQEITRQGLRPIPCGEERPLTPTAFRQFMRRSGLSFSEGFYDRWSLREVPSDPNNPCVPPRW